MKNKWIWIILVIILIIILLGWFGYLNFMGIKGGKCISGAVGYTTPDRYENGKCTHI